MNDTVFKICMPEFNSNAIERPNVRRGQYQAAVREIMFLMGIESVSRRNFNRAVAVVRKVSTTPETPNEQAAEPLPQAPCSAKRALECCEIWAKADIAYYHDSSFLPNLQHRLRCIREGLEDLKHSPND